MWLISKILPSLIIELAQKKRIQITLSFNQTMTYYIVREWKMFVINPIDPIRRCYFILIENKSKDFNKHLSLL